LQQTVAGGGMLALGMSAQALAPWREGIGGVLDIAAYNAANSITLSGDPDSLAQLEQRLAQAKGARRIFARRLTVEVAYHSAHMDGLQSALLAELAGLQPQSPVLPLFSSVSGSQVSNASHDAQYWWRNARHPVQFMAAMQQIHQYGFARYLQIGPHPALSSAIKANTGETVQRLALIDRKQDALASLSSVLEALQASQDP
jgi:acyl transferase domain-containing protein